MLRQRRLNCPQSKCKDFNLKILKGEKEFMKKVVDKVNQLMIRAKFAVSEKKEAVDQIIIMFIIIAVAAGIAGLLYLFGTGKLLPNFENKMTEFINNRFSHS